MFLKIKISDRTEFIKNKIFLSEEQMIYSLTLKKFSRFVAD